MTWTHAAESAGSNGAALPLVNVAKDNLIIAEVINFGNNTVWATALSGGGATWVPVGVKITGTTNTFTAAVFIGRVTATGAQTATITWSGTTPGSFVTAASEFHSSLGSWAFDKQGQIDSAGTTNFPSLTPTNNGELYWGFATTIASSSAGTTTGYVYNANADTATDGSAYNLNCAAGIATFPVWATAQETFGIAVLIQEVASPPANIRVNQYGPGYIPSQTIPGTPLGTPFLNVLGGDGPGASTAVAIGLSETGAGFESLAIASDVSLAESGVGTDALAINSSVSLSELGAGTDSLAVTSSIPLSDSGSGTDAIAIASDVSLAESGVGTDALTVQIQTVADHPVQQYGPGWFPGAPGSPLSTPFYVSPGDAQIQAGIPVSLAEAGTGSEALAIAADVPMAETGVGADALAISSTISLPETGAGSEALSLAADVPLAESGTGTDSISVQITTVADYPTAQYGPGWRPGLPGAPLNTPFYVSPSDSQPTPGVPITLTETGAGSETIAISADVSLAETGSGSDALAVTASVALAETGAGTDSLAISDDIALAESGTGTDTLAVQVSTFSASDLPVNQYSPGWRPGLPGNPLGTPFYVAPGDNELLAGIPVALAEVGAGSDTLTIASGVGLAETGAGTDTLAIASSVALADVGAGSDALGVAVGVAFTEAGAGSEALSVAATVALSESGVASDALSVSVIKAPPFDASAPSYGPGWKPGLPGMPRGIPFYAPQRDSPSLAAGFPGRVSTGNKIASPVSISHSSSTAVLTSDKQIAGVVTKQAATSVRISNRQASTVKVDNIS